MYSAWIGTHLKKLFVLASYFKRDKVEQLNEASMVRDYLRDEEITGDSQPGKEPAGNVIAGSKYLKGYCGKE